MRDCDVIDLEKFVALPNDSARRCRGASQQLVDDNRSVLYILHTCMKKYVSVSVLYILHTQMKKYVSVGIFHTQSHAHAHTHLDHQPNCAAASLAHVRELLQFDCAHTHTSTKRLCLCKQWGFQGRALMGRDGTGTVLLLAGYCPRGRRAPRGQARP